MITVWFICVGPLSTVVFSAPAETQDQLAPDSTLPDRTDAGPLLLNGSVLLVNDGAITSTEVLAPLQSQLREWAANSDRAQFLNQLRQALAENTMVSLRNLLLYQHAKSQLAKNENFEAALEAQIKEKRKTLISTYGGSEARTQEELARNSSSIEKELEQIKQSMVINAYQQTYFSSSLEITRAQMMQYYRTNLKEKYFQTPKIQFQLIEIRADTFPAEPNDAESPESLLPQARNAAAKTAQAAWQKINHGADFTPIVREYSHGFLKENDGLSRLLNPDSLHDRYQPVIDALEKININQCTPVIETEDRFFIAKLIDRQQAKIKPFPEVQNEIHTLLRQQQWQKYTAQLVSELWNKATVGNIEQFVDELALTAYQQLKPQITDK